MKNHQNHLAVLKRLAVLLLVLLAIVQTGLSQNNKEKLKNGWFFYKGDIGSPWEAFRSSALSNLPKFSPVAIPHCYNAYDAVDPDKPYYQGPAWYYTMLKVDNPYHNGRTVLCFDGAGQKTDVYVFMHKVATHVGGYDKWKVDITRNAAEFLKKYKTGVGKVPAGEVPVAVRCDNSRDVNRIPSQLSDFTVYGGLYRNVYLEYLPEISMEQVHVSYTLKKRMHIAWVSVRMTLYNPLKISRDIDVQIKILNQKNKIVYSYTKDTLSWSTDALVVHFPLKNIHLWSPDFPYLYTVQVSFKVNNEIQKKTIKIGFRQFQFKEKGPFFLNGKRLLIRGTSRHEDYAGEGAAGTEKEMRREMIMIKEMGANFIRLGHYQQPDYILNLCDSLGIMVWEEIPWCRGGLGDSAYQNQAKSMLAHLINQHYNHPSVIIWGLGNENDWPGDFPVFDKEKIIDFMMQLNKLAHQLDSSRETAIRRCDFCKHIVDVYSPSIWAGWYRGRYTDYKKVSYSQAMSVDHFFHAEWGASMHSHRHSELPDKGLGQIKHQNAADERSGDFLLTGGAPRVSKDGDWSETYGCNLIDWTLKEQENMPWLTGTAFWIFKDFSTPLRPDNPIPYVNEKGVTQRDLTPKEAYYVFQSYWSQKPMMHIYGHTWPVRWGQPGENKLIKVYSNCDRVELFLNGKNLGFRKRNTQNFPASGLRWKTPFRKGVNYVRAVGYVKGKPILRDSLHFYYQTQKWDKPKKLVMTKEFVTPDKVFVQVKAYDEKGVFCPTAKNKVTFGVTGRGKLLDDMGTINGSRKIQLSNGVAGIFVQLHGTAVVSVSSKDMPATFLKVQIKK